MHDRLSGLSAFAVDRLFGRMGLRRTPADPIVRSIGTADLKEALDKGVSDFVPFLDLLAEPLYLVSLSIIYAILSICLISGGLPLLFPLLSGFALVGFFAVRYAA